LANRENEVFAATRMKSTSGREDGTNAILVEPHELDEDERQDSREKANHDGFASRVSFAETCGSKFVSDSFNSTSVGMLEVRGISPRSIPDGNPSRVNR